MLYEGYLELCLATCLNSLSLYYALKEGDQQSGSEDSSESVDGQKRVLGESEVDSGDKSEFALYFSNIYDCLSSVLTILFLIFYIFGLPVFLFRRARIDFQKFKEEKEDYISTGN